MSGGDDIQRMRVDSGQLNPMPIDSRSLVVSALRHIEQNPPFMMEETHNGNYGQPYQKHEDDLMELGEKIKHHEENIRYLKNLRNRYDSLILDLQVAMEKYHTGSFSKVENEDSVSVESEGGFFQHILKYENSAAAILYKIKCDPESQVSDQKLSEDVVGFVATLAKVDDANLSRVLSEYLGLETMLAVVCKTYEGVKSLEGLVDDRFLVICLERLRPYTGGVIVDDPQRRLDILKPRLVSGETPPGFLGFAVNMLTIDCNNLYPTSKNDHNLRETLYYNLFSDLQVYKSRQEMLKALPYIKHGAVSLDGGVIRSPGCFSLGRHGDDIGVKFSCDSRCSLPENYFEIQNRLKEAKWKKDISLEDMQIEQAILDQAKFNYEKKKKDFVQFIAETSSYASAAQYQMGRVSTPM